MKKLRIIMVIILIVSQLTLSNLLVYASSDGAVYTTRDVTNGVVITGYTGGGTDIVIPGEINGKTVVEIGSNAFAYKPLTSVKIPSSVTMIGEGAFQDNQLTSVKIPSNVTRIGINAFKNNQLTSVEIPSDVTWIGIDAFAGNSLDFVTFQGMDGSRWKSAFTNQSKNGKSFMGWYADEERKILWGDSVNKPRTIYAGWSPLTVNFDTNGGSIDSLKSVVFDKLVKAPTTPVKEGYTFTGWYKDEELTKVWNFDQDKVRKDLTLYAKWSKESYTVTFEANGGDDVTPQTVEYDELVKAPATPEKAGYTFAGWYKDKELTKEWNFNQDIVKGKTTLFTKWSKESYTVTFEANGGNDITPQTVEYDELVKAPATPEKAGYIFAGWYKDKGLTAAWNFDQDKVKNDLTLYAKWSKESNSYIVTFDTNGGGEVASQTVGDNKLVEVLVAPHKEGYTFDGWYKDKELTVPWDFANDVVTKNVTLYAKWINNTSGGGTGGGSSNYKVTFDANSGSEVPSQTVRYNDLVKVPTTPVKEGYTFDGWYKDAELKNVWEFAQDRVTADLTLYAKWTKDHVSEGSYTVTFDANGGSEVPSQTVADKALVNAPAKPTKKGHILIGWYTNKEFTKAWDFAKDVVTEDVTLYARWMQESTSCDITFKDIDRNWAQDMIQEVANRCIIKGYPDGTFRPNDKIQRQHVVLMMDRALQPTPIRGAVAFSDVPKSHVYYEQITRLQRAGIVDGDNGAFRPNAYITRAQMAKIMVLAFGLTPEGKSKFKDVDSSHWASGYIAALADHDIALGDENGNFRPNESLTRAQFTALVYRALGL
ncbi:InlB B-repeat-containing protein [Lysinibacillus sp. Bpr_S20]|uniref:InlB B-repeat-containing protein n=1 Tax=Lysinibacillus sp. Bpr_S20 TaxID=2933964 RepID=UPI00201134A8|nr:InlB B-repeat-containing protein [Lysinibacillus sp. Bpr_S20]MCL1702653.1 InlB B-repeat-containing protein [Lysinibacillus sp. Bpr_S20]